MFGLLFGWRKASKCKKVIKEAQCRLKLLKSKRHSIVKHLREDTANLIKIGHEDIALTRAEQLIKDESIAVAYELIDNFFDFIRTHFSYIRRHKDCPDDINEAVSSLIYASARCGDLPELRMIRELFEERYGHKLAMSAVDLFPGNLVNPQVKEALNMNFVPDDMKLRMVNEIATDYCLQRRILALEYYPELQQEVKESSDHRQLVAMDIQTSMDERSEARISNVEPEGKATLLDSLPKCHLQSSQGTETACATFSGSRNTTGTIVKASSSSESLPSFDEETLLVYLDDIEELPSSKDEDSQDRRIFKFKSPVLSRTVSFQDNFDPRYDTEKYESWNENSSPNTSSRKSRSITRKRTRRRLVYPENQGIEDMECTSYYAQPYKHRYSVHQKQQKNGQAKEESERSVLSGEIRVTPSASNRRNHRKKFDIKSSQPEQKYLSTRHPRELVTSSAESDNVTELSSKRSSKSRICRQKSEAKGPEELDNGSQRSCVSAISCRTRKGVSSGYSRAETMPLERSKKIATKDDFQRSNSCPVQEYPNHVHPKLPDCDELTARFMALKKEFLINNNSNVNRSHRQC